MTKPKPAPAKPQTPPQSEAEQQPPQDDKEEGGADHEFEGNNQASASAASEPMETEPTA